MPPLNPEARLVQDAVQIGANSVTAFHVNIAAAGIGPNRLLHQRFGELQLSAVPQFKQHLALKVLVFLAVLQNQSGQLLFFGPPYQMFNHCFSLCRVHCRFVRSLPGVPFLEGQQRRDNVFADRPPVVRAVAEPVLDFAVIRKIDFHQIRVLLAAGHLCRCVTAVPINALYHP